jgi:N-acetylglucosamine-6-phosphate deacetylase
MNSGEITAWHYTTRQPVRLRWQGGRITSLDPAPVPPPGGLWIAPPLVDPQVNGYAGVDFQRDGLTTDDLLRATRGLRAAGCAHFLLTLITDGWPKLLARLKHLRALRDQSPELRDAILGWHIEGPFLSAEPGFRGAHNPEAMCDPSPRHVDELRAASGDDPVLLTVAPERAGALPAIARAVSLGIRVSLGHTNAPLDRIRAAVQAGATAFTHLANGCPKDLDRHDNILWRVFDTPGLTVGLIPDGIHVSPMFFRLAHRVLGHSAIYYTTDAMAAAGSPPGRYTIGRLELEVGTDQVVRLPGQPNFAGSALRPIDGITRAAEMLGCDWQAVWDRLARAPRELMGCPQDLSGGQPANFCLLKATTANQFSALKLFLHGELAPANDPAKS